MRKILVVSDTHGYTGNLEKVMRNNRNVDLMIHLGDVCNDENDILARAHYPVKFVRGNNDWSYSLPDKAIMQMDGHKIFATHGHNYNVYYGIERLILAGLEQDCDIIMFGHTHVPVIQEGDDYTVINPGSLTYPRQSGHQPSYILMTIQDSGEVEYELRYVNRDDA